MKIVLIKIVANILKKIPEEHWRLLEVIAFILAIIGFFQAKESIGLSEQESLERYKQLEPAVLNVTHWVNISDPQDKSLFINIKNMAQYKPTGNISLYKIEINPHRPAILLPSLNAGENTTISLGINYSIATYPPGFGEFLFEDLYVRNVTIPAYKLYYVTST